MALAPTLRHGGTIAFNPAPFVSSALAAFWTASAAHGESWPSRDIKIVCPFGPGGSADVIGRYIAIQLKRSLRHTVVVENRTGAGGTLGTHSVATAEPDGYTLAGSVDYFFDAIPTMAETIRENRVRALGTTGLKRDQLLPDIPTIAETLPGFEGPIWIGLLAPAKTPKPIVDRLNEEVTKILKSPATAEWHAKIGAQPMPMSAAEFTDFLGKDIEKQKRWILAAHIAAE